MFSTTISTFKFITVCSLSYDTSVPSIATFYQLVWCRNLFTNTFCGNEIWSVNRGTDCTDICLPATASFTQLLAINKPTCLLMWLGGGSQRVEEYLNYFVINPSRMKGFKFQLLSKLVQFYLTLECIHPHTAHQEQHWRVNDKILLFPY